MKPDTDTVEDLAKIIELRTQEIKHWRNMIDKYADGDNKLKDFEYLLGKTHEKFQTFRDRVAKSKETADELEAKLKTALADRSKTINSLRTDIHNLKQSIDKISDENSQLEKALKEDAEQLNKLKYTRDFPTASYSNSGGTEYIKRLSENLVRDT